MPQSKHSPEKKYAQNKKMSRSLIGVITLASFGMGVYLGFSQNYFGSALFILLPVMLVATLVKRSSG